jgi:zinc protease
MKLAAILLTIAAAAQTAAPPVKAPEPKWNTLKFPALRDPKIPEVTQFTLPNGMRVFLLENHELPVVSGFAMVRTGNLFDPKEKVGLADITGAVMRTGGAAGKSGDALNEQLENIAASVESSIGETSGRVGFNCLKENQAEVLGAFKAVLTAPDFAQDKVDLAKTQEKSAIARRNDDPGGIASREFNQIVYGRTTPFGWRQEYATVDAITRADLAAFHKRYFFPKNILLGVYGDFDTAQMRAQLEKLFADWTVEQPAVPEFPKVTQPAQPGIHLATKQDVNQTNFFIGHLGGTLRDKDYPALEVMASVLGGSPFTSRLGSAIRVQRGYAYSIGAGWAANYNHPGTFYIVGGTKSENTVAAVKTIREEVDKFLQSEPSAAELQSAKDKILNAFVFNFDSPSKTLSRLATYEYQGYPKDFIFQYKAAIEKVTPSDVLRVAKQYLKPANFTYVLVGKPSDFGTPLDALGLPVTNIDLTIPEPKVEVSKADDASLAKGAALVRKMAEAMGGASKIEALKDYSVAYDVEIAGGGGMMKAKQRQLWLAPGHIRQENELPFGKIVAYYDGAGGWIKLPQGEAPLSGPVLRQMQEQAFHDIVGLPYGLLTKNWKANYVSNGVVEVSDGAGLVTKVEIDEATGAPKKQSYQAVGVGGAQAVEEVYGPLKDFGGFKIPASTVVFQGGKKFADQKLTAAEFNTGLTAAQLSAKP